MNKEECKAVKHSLGVVRISDGWVCYYCGKRVSNNTYSPTSDFGKKGYTECHCYCFQPLTKEQKDNNVEKWMDEPILDEFLDPRIYDIPDGWKFRYKRNIARTCPICFEDLNWWNIDSGSESMECSNPACGFDGSSDNISHHLWRKRFVELLNQQAIEALKRVGEDTPGGGAESAKIFEKIGNLIKEYEDREMINEPNRRTPREEGLTPKKI